MEWMEWNEKEEEEGDTEKPSNVIIMISYGTWTAGFDTR